MAIHDWTRVSAGIFHHFHLEWISTISRALNSGLLPPGYYALAEQIAGGRQPDVLALEGVPPRSGGNGSHRHAGEGGGGVALATARPQVRYTAEAESEEYLQKQRRVAVRHSSDDRVVALVEIVSPGNKDRPATTDDFVEKGVEFIRSGIHLLILDLFRPSDHEPEGLATAIWSHFAAPDFHLPPNEPLALASFSAGFVKRAFIEPTAVGKPLPDMPLFLEPEIYVPVPLEATYQAAFDSVPQRWRSELLP